MTVTEFLHGPLTAPEDRGHRCAGGDSDAYNVTFVAILLGVANKSEPLTVRLSPETSDFVRDEAKRTKRSRGAIVRDLTEEAARERMFPGIVFTGPDASRRASVSGTGWDVWQVIETHRNFGSIGPIVEDFNLTERHIRVALAYHDRFPGEIDEAMARNDRPLEELMRELPWAEVLEAPAE